jgi:hypothetical protein
MKNFNQHGENAAVYDWIEEGFQDLVWNHDGGNLICTEFVRANKTDFRNFSDADRVRLGKATLTATVGPGAENLHSIETNAEDRGVPATAPNTRGLDTAPIWSGGYTPGTSSNATDAYSNEANRLMSREERVAKALADIKQRLKSVGKGKSGRAESDLESDNLLFTEGGHRGRAALAK